MSEARNVAEAMNIPANFPVVRQVKSQVSKEPEEEFRINVFNVIVDEITSGLRTRFEAAHVINQKFCFLWQYRDMSEEEICKSSSDFSKFYENDVCGKKLKDELLNLKRIHAANFGSESLNPAPLLNMISKYNLLGVFPNVSIALRIFCTLPVTVASAERSFSKLKYIKNDLRTTMAQNRLNDLTTLSIESDLARKLDFSQCISTFAAKAARKVHL